jgi:PAS domain S-box-containing protein
MRAENQSVVVSPSADTLESRLTRFCVSLNGLSHEECLRRFRIFASELVETRNAESEQWKHAAGEHRHRAENLMALAQDLKPSLPLSGFARCFVQRAVQMMGARASAVALAHGSRLETLFLYGLASPPEPDMQRRLAAALIEPEGGWSGGFISGRAGDLLGQGLANALGWRSVTLASLTGRQGEPLGVLCLADIPRGLTATDQNLLRAITAHASVAIENTRLFSRIEDSKKQWVEDFDAITDRIVVHDASCRILRVNRPLADSLGAKPAALTGTPMSALRPLAEEASARDCPFCREEEEPAEEYILPAYGRSYLISTSRIRGATEDGLRTIHVIKDVTDRREAERRYSELFDNIQEGLFFCTPEGRFIDANAALVRMLGFANREELLQANLFQLCIRPESRRRLLEAVEETGSLRNYEEVLRRRDGVILHTMQNISSVRDAAGHIALLRGLMLDVTEQKTFQAQLQRERDFNLKILDNTQSLILVLDTAGLVSYANRRCFEAGYQRQDLLGHPFLEYVAPGRRSVFSEALDTTLNGRQVDNVELPVRLGSGSPGRFSLNLSPMRDAQGHISSIVVVMMDVTDAAVLHAKLLHAEKMAAVGQLVSGVAHEVNNPLAAILGFTDLLLENPEVPESAKAELGVILQEAQRTKVIVQNLLRFARQVPAQREPVELNSLLLQTLKLRSYDFGSHGVDVVEQLDEGLPLLIGDAHQLQQVFLNILNNAYDAVRETARRGRIEIGTSLSGGIVEVVFRDNGPGIADLDCIFDPFFTTKEVGKGTGLGLSICYGIVRAHGGEILCSNNEGGEGCTFRVRLPLTFETADCPSEGVTR